MPAAMSIAQPSGWELLATASPFALPNGPAQQPGPLGELCARKTYMRAGSGAADGSACLPAPATMLSKMSQSASPPRPAHFCW